MSLVQELFSKIPTEVLDVFELINSKSFRVGVVGGIVRDYIVSSKVGTDFDCEVRPENHNDFIKQYHSLCDELSVYYQTKKLNYGVFRITLNHAEIEQSLPKIRTLQR